MRLTACQALIGLLRSTKAANKRTYVQALGSLARTVYHRMGKHVAGEGCLMCCLFSYAFARAAISPLLREAIQAANKEGDEDLKENVLQVRWRCTASVVVDISPRHTRRLCCAARRT